MLFSEIILEVSSADGGTEHYWSSKGMQLVKSERTNGLSMAYLVTARP